MRKKIRLPAIAYIREEECIGCTKCIEACPFDAIIGSAKQIHTVLIAECTGCQLCIAPCPVDCIDVIPQSVKTYDPHRARERYQTRKLRLLKLEQQNKNKPNEKLAAQRAYVDAAVARAQAKRNTQQEK